jgi:DUF4097 and DUF4098 domain-containing protein YvlB
MAGYPPPPPPPPYGFDPRSQARMLREQARAARDQARAQRMASKAQWAQWCYQMRGARRGSVLGPILLIAVGLIFLLLETGHLPHDQFWEWYGHWWPFLLVGAGLILLAEWALDQFMLRDPDRPRYRRSIGGGVVLLLIVLCTTGPVMGRIHDGSRNFLGHGFNFNPDNFDELFGDKHDSDQTLDHSFAAGDSLSIENPRGDVTVSGISDDGQVHISVHKQVFSHSDSSADSMAQRLVPQLNASGSAILLKMPSVEGAQADLVVTVPNSATTTITSNHGDIHVSGIRASVVATANHGDIELSAVTGAATARINRGSSLSAHNIGGAVTVEGRADDVTLSDVGGAVSMNGDFYGSVHLEHIAGAVRFHTSRTDLQFGRLDGEVEISSDNIYAEQALGPFVLTTHNANVTLDRVAGDVTVTDRNGSVDLTAAPPLGNVTIEDRNGSVKMVAPERAGFTVQASTSDGDIDTDFSLSPTGDDRGKKLNGTIGGGGPLVRITTTHNNISLTKGSVEQLPPKPPAPPKITLTPPGLPTAPGMPTPPATPKKPANTPAKPVPATSE